MSYREIRFFWRILGFFFAMLFVSSSAVMVYVIESNGGNLVEHFAYKRVLYMSFGLNLIYWLFAFVNILYDIKNEVSLKKLGDKNDL